MGRGALTEPSSLEGFPAFIDDLPSPDSNVPMRARIVSGGDILPMFYEVDTDIEIPEHRHGAQWGVVLEGSMEMMIGGEERLYSRGDTYFVPSGVDHVTRIRAGYRGIDVFADPQRYVPREGTAE